MSDIVFAVSDFVAVFNQTITTAYPNVVIRGELANFKISKNRWVYFDLKDELASVRFFGTVYQIPAPLEDGMLLTVQGIPQLHPRFGFSITILNIELSGQGTIERAKQLLQAKLTAEGLFDLSRKRSLPMPPFSIGLIASRESAAYKDFMKILNERWGGITIQLYDTLVQGAEAPASIVQALEYFNTQAKPPEVLVVTRGGGSADDLQAFSTELVTRAVAASRIPTLVAIGHEVDQSLAEMAADRRASTPSNAAQVLVPDRNATKRLLEAEHHQIDQVMTTLFVSEQQFLKQQQQTIDQQLLHKLSIHNQALLAVKQLLDLLHPKAILKRGYAIVRSSGKVVRSVKQVHIDDILSIELQDGKLKSIIKDTVQ